MFVPLHNTLLCFAWFGTSCRWNPTVCIVLSFAQLCFRALSIFLLAAVVGSFFYPGVLFRCMNTSQSIYLFHCGGIAGLFLDFGLSLLLYLAKGKRKTSPPTEAEGLEVTSEYRLAWFCLGHKEVKRMVSVTL